MYLYQLQSLDINACRAFVYPIFVKVILMIDAYSLIKLKTRHTVENIILYIYRVIAKGSISKTNFELVMKNNNAFKIFDALFIHLLKKIV